MVAQGGFRADLYYRLNVLTIALPPLRERGDDILLLAQTFATQTARRYGLAAPALSAQAQAAMLAYAWPGNVRELKHLVERAVMLARGQVIDVADLGISAGPIAAAAGGSDPLNGLTLEEAERLLIQRALHATSGNVSEAARRLGVSRMTMRYRMEKYGMKGD
jgi:DNA-binding NtrC family response regulator